MTHVRWWQSAVVYQIYPRSWQDTNADGVGDLRGIIQRLPYLAETLDVDAIWVSPFYPSPMTDFGYDISDFTDVDPLFGDLADFDDLVAASHAAGVRVILDYVPNHTADTHPWFAESRSARTSPKRDWYVWRDPRPDGSPPNNWVEETGGSVWQWDQGTEQYYLHSHYVSQPDLNWRNLAVRQAMFDVLHFWLRRGVDGFRVDVPHLIMKDPALRDNPPDPNPVVTGLDRRHPGFYGQLHLHDRQHPDLHPVFRQMRALVDGYGPDKVLIGEVEISSWNTWRLYFGGRLDEFHVPFNFQLIETPWTAADIRRVVDELEAAVPAGAWPNYVLGNHDRSRIATRYGPAAARAAAVLLLTLRGTITLYYGDEIGMRDADLDPADELDPLGRDSSRTPMPWDASRQAGFCRPAVAPWLPLGPDPADHDVEAALLDSSSQLHLYRRLIQLRHSSPALREGDYRSHDLPSPDCFAFSRRAGDDHVTVLINFSPGPCTVPAPIAGTVVVSTHTGRSQTITPEGTITLAGNEAVVIAAAPWLDLSSERTSALAVSAHHHERRLPG